MHRNARTPHHAPPVHQASDLRHRRWRTAVVYAEALVAAAQKAGVIDAVVQEFDSLIDDVLEKMPKLEAVFTSGFVDEEVKEAMLKKAFAQQASPCSSASCKSWLATAGSICSGSFT